MTLCMNPLSNRQRRPLGSRGADDTALSGKTFFYGLDLKHNRLFHVSCAVKDVLGYTPREIMQNGLSWFVQQIDTDDLAALDQLCRQDQSMIVPQIHYHFKTKQGTCCEVYEHRCLLHDAGGRPSFIIGRVEKV